MVEPLSKEVLQRKRRYTCRHTAGVIVQMMARSDLDFGAIGKRCGRSAASVRRVIYALIEGNPVELDTLSDIALSMGYEYLFSAKPVPEEELVNTSEKKAA
jgi:hypothetical protein